MRRVLGCGGFFLCTLVLFLYLFSGVSLEVFDVGVEDVVLYERVVVSGGEVEVEEVVVSGVSEDMDWGVPSGGKNTIEFPVLGVRAGIYDGLGEDALLRGLGWHESTVRVGERGNAVLAGHSSDVYACVLNGLSGTVAGDVFWVWDGAGVRHEYRVVDTFVVSGSDVSILDTVRDDISMVTVYTCTSDGRGRFVVVGLELDEEGYALEMRSRGYHRVVRLKELVKSYRYSNVFDYFTNRGYALERRGIWYGQPFDKGGLDEFCGRIEVW